MTYEPLTSGGPIFSRIIAGVWRWRLPVNEVEVLIHKALDAGMTTFDNADIYGDYQNEQTFGTVLEGTSSLREKMQLVTKCCIMNVSTQRPSNWIKHYNTSRQHIVWSVENSLKSLHT